jgi:hypothetical protein
METPCTCFKLFAEEMILDHGNTMHLVAEQKMINGHELDLSMGENR